MSETVKMLPRYRVPVVEKKKHGNGKTHEQYVKDLKVKNPTVEVVDKYINSHTKITHHCLIHDVYWESAPNNVLQGKGCNKCLRERIANKNRKSHEEYIEEVKSKNPNIIVKEQYVNINTAILHECILHNITWLGIPSTVLASLGCSECIKEKLGHSLHKTHEEYIEELKIKNPNVIPLEKYIDSKTPILHYYKDCGHKTKTSPMVVLRGIGIGCSLCRGTKISKTLSKTHEQFIQEMSQVNKNIEIKSNYINGQEKVLCGCKICKHEWESRASHLLQGHGCPKCAIVILADQKRKDRDTFINELFKLNPYIEVLGDYISTNQKILCRCKKCNYEWNVTPAKLLNKRGCPVCNESIGERTINIFLTSNSISYIKYHKYDDLIGIGGGLLSYDFYLPQFNLLIEFQGEQHERPIDFFGGEEKFKIQQEHDNRKRNYAKDNNINLLEIWYYDIDNIETILTEYLNNLKLESVTTTGVA